MKKKSLLRITYVRSTIGRPAKQKRTIEALGFKRLNQWLIKVDNPQIRGMILKVSHLLKVEEVVERTPVKKRSVNKR